MRKRMRFTGRALLVLIALLSRMVVGESFFGDIQVSGTNAVISTQDTRSLASLVATFSRSYHILVFYEEAPVLFKADMVNTAAPQIAQAGGHVWIPRGGALHATYLLSSPTGHPVNAKDALTSFVRLHESAGYPGQYKVTEDIGLFSVLPSETKDVNGIFVNVSPLLLTRVSVYSQDTHNIAEGIDKVLETMSARGPKISLGALLPQQVLRHSLKGDLINVTAEEAIRTLLDQGDAGRMSLLLLYDPEFKRFVLNLYAIT